MRKYAVLLLILCIAIPAIVLAEPPKCILKADPVSGDAPLTVKVSEDSGDATIVDWWYDFGDEQYLYHEAKGEHVYEKAGEFTLTLHVLNDKGEESTDKATIVVTAKETPTPTPTATPAPKPTMNETTTVKVVYQGNTTIKDSLATKSPTTSESAILKTATEAVMSKVTYPYNVTKEEVKTTFKIQKYRCDEKMQVCGYWIEAWRDGKEVATNSPVWLASSPYEAVLSQLYDEKTNELTTTVKEDPKLAVEQILQAYVDNQPLGKAVVGTKE